MKIVNIVFAVVFLLVVFGCKDGHEHNMPAAPAKSVIDFDADSVYYKIDVKGDEAKELFLVTREIVVADSSFGGYSYENSQKAWKYSQIKYADKNATYDFLYRVLFYENGHYKEVSKLLFYGDGITYPVLKKGDFTNTDVVAKKNFEHEGTQYLRIVEISDNSLSCRSVNLTCQNKKWKIFSKQIVNTYMGSEYKSYCIDTIQNNLTIDYVCYDDLFDLFNSEFTCSE